MQHHIELQPGDTVYITNPANCANVVIAADVVNDPTAYSVEYRVSDDPGAPEQTAIICAEGIDPT